MSKSDETAMIPFNAQFFPVLPQMHTLSNIVFANLQCNSLKKEVVLIDYSLDRTKAWKQEINAKIEE